MFNDNLFLHFFKSLSDAAKMNLNIKAEGQNEHDKDKLTQQLITALQRLGHRT